MRIILIRHGKPKIETSGWVSMNKFGAWVSNYNMAEIDREYPPPVEAMNIVKSSVFRVCSTLPRSIESAKLLKINEPELISPMYRECEMPYGKWAFPKLPKSIWSLVFRTLQLLGCSPNAESYKEIKARSKKCATQLIDLAKNHGEVLFVGHGVLNWLLHKELLNMGWSGPMKSTKNHWEFGEYIKQKT